MNTNTAHSTHFPQYIDLDIGETVHMQVAEHQHQITLNSITHSYEPDLWIDDNPTRQTLQQAQVSLHIDGDPVLLLQHPYIMPVEYHGLRLYVENTREWATACNLAGLPSLKKAVRLSVGPAEQAWGDPSLRFPIRDYRWRSSSYNNTWSSLVPYNLLYYHRGDDFGAIPDQLDVLAMLDGIITTSPVPQAAGANSLVIEGETGLSVRYVHMNIETIDPTLIPGTHVKAGQVLGKTGCTWNGLRSQHNDPHLHIAFDFKGKRISSYPSLVEAYLRDYPDAALAIAGGYSFAVVGDTINLDASHSYARPGDRITKYVWHLHDGQEVQNTTANVAYTKPGQYAEVLTITTESGYTTSDVAHVRVYHPELNQAIGYGWLYATPVRGITPGQKITFWNRLVNNRGTTVIEYGDSSPAVCIEDELSHAYTKPGQYIVTLTGNDSYGSDIQAKIPMNVTIP